MAKQKVLRLQIREGLFTARNVKWILIAVSVIITLILVVMYIRSAPLTKTGKIAPSRANQHLISIALITAVGPYAIYAWYHNRRINSIETKFADFLKDLAEYWKVGISMTTAIRTLAHGDYGAMTGEIQKMNAQISWGVAFNEVLHQMSQRIQTKLVTRSVSLIEEANLAGG